MSEVNERLRYENNLLHEALIKLHNEREELNEEIKDLRLKIWTLLFGLVASSAVLVTILYS